MGLIDRLRAAELTDADLRRLIRLAEVDDLRTEAAELRSRLSVDADLYQYTAMVTAVYDGDSITVDLDKGFGEIEPDVGLRLYGINTNELRGHDEAHRAVGRQVRDYVRSLILGRAVLLRTHKARGLSLASRRGKYGRYLVEVLAVGGDGQLVNLNQHLVESGRAEFNTYGDPFDGWAVPPTLVEL